MHHQWFGHRRSAWAGPGDTHVASASMAVGIEVALDEGVQLIRFSRPGKKNALSSQMYSALCNALDRGDASDDVVVHVFVGSAGVFTAGNDLADFLAFSAAPDARRLPALDFIDRLPRVSKPMVAAVDGLAVGVGTTMLLHCDLVYASPSASFRTPFVDLGLVPEAGSSLLAVQRMGYARAFELLCLGEPFDAERALGAGLVNAVVPTEQLEQTALAAARRLVAKPREALQASRRLMRGDTSALLDRMAAEIREFSHRLTTDEAQSALEAVLQRRS